MNINSIWLDGIKFDRVEELTKNISIDVLIIGGGITGLSTAYHLINSNLKVCIVEKNLIAHGVSSRTTGKLTFLQDNIYTKLNDKAHIYYKSQRDAIKLVEDIISKNNIDCDYKKIESYIYIDKYNNLNKIRQEENMLRKLGIKYEVYKNIPDSFECKYAIGVSDTAIFHPIKYLNNLKKIIIDNGINVYENSGVTEIRKVEDFYLCKVNDKTIKAKKIVIASHYPYFLFPYLVPFKTYIEKSYISVSIVDKIKDYSAITLSKPIKSIRYQEDKNKYLIYLTGTHNLCNKYNNKDNFNKLLSDLEKLNLKPKYIWTNQDLMTEDSLPYIGYIDNNLLIGTGYNTWGMTNGSLAGKILSDLILGKDNEYKELFNPKRNKKLNILKYPVYMSYSAKSFIENKIAKNKSWYKDNVKFTKRDGKNVAIYIDENNKEHIVYNLCPHMKCSLLFNEVEKTWDCPCHGSRFDIDGKCIFGPSKEDIGFKN